MELQRLNNVTSQKFFSENVNLSPENTFVKQELSGPVRSIAPDHDLQPASYPCSEMTDHLKGYLLPQLI